jgi:hypothetical protein
LSFFIKTGILLISGRAIKIYTLQKKILITATDIFAISSQKQFEKTALKVFRYQHENNLVQRVLRPNESGVAKNKNTQQIPFYPFSFSRAMLWFLIPIW